MLGSPFARLTGVLGMAGMALAAVSPVRADGEAGLVIQDGDTVTTYCVAFQGDGIRGDALLRTAGHTFDAYGGASGLAVCSIDGHGCNDASSFSSCFCQCQGSSCTYWAFFTRSYGKNWVYSSLAFNLLEAKDGEVHAWKWGAGGPSSAPAPREITFDQICGHAPRGGASPPAATATAGAPTAAATSVAVPTTGATVATTAPATMTGSPATSATAPLVTITNAAETPAANLRETPAAPSPGGSGGDDRGSTSLALFGGLAAALLVLLGAGVVWRKRHGS